MEPNKNNDYFSHVAENILRKSPEPTKQEQDAKAPAPTKGSTLATPAQTQGTQTKPTQTPATPAPARPTQAQAAAGGGEQFTTFQKAVVGLLALQSFLLFVFIILYYTAAKDWM